MAIIRVNEPSREKLSAITPEDVEAEGFPGMTPTQFIRMFCDSHESCRPSTIITRIPYAYVPGGRFTLPGFCRFCGDRAAATSTKCSKCEFVDQFSESLKHD
ncbi:hypothetical protein [Schlesneria sp. DSM 10557]|uniref:hypothetical protein n=1 Tax=Schlesneria sp. DSM 10557 TaxID=3044399 RepID=UPI0035A09A2E